MIEIVGCGPGAEDQLTMAAKKAIDQADILIGAQRLLDLRKSEATEKIAVTSHIDDVINSIAEHHAHNQDVTVLVSGDPGIFSLAKRVIKTFGISQCRVIPGISSIQTAFARLGMCWHDARIISAHHQLPDLDAIPLDSTRKMAVLSGRDDVLQWLQQLIIRLGHDTTVYACEDLTLYNEKIRKLSERDLTERAFSSRCVFLIIGKDQDK